MQVVCLSYPSASTSRLSLTMLYSTRLLLLLSLFVLTAYSLRHQAVAIKGKLLCGTAPARNVRVKLWEEDSGKLLLIFIVPDIINQGFKNLKSYLETQNFIKAILVC